MRYGLVQGAKKRKRKRRKLGGVRYSKGKKTRGYQRDQARQEMQRHDAGS